MNYYNEHDPDAAAWLRELILAGEIPAGEVDGRDIRDVKAADLVGFTQHHFFAGIGGWSYALKLAGWPNDRPVCTASLPCQPFSQAGKQKAEADPRHLWPVFFELVNQCRFPVCIGEQVASPLGRAWLAGVRTDLEAAGYRVGAANLCAAGAGAQKDTLGERLARHITNRLGELAGELFREWWVESGNYAIYDREPGAPHIRQRLYWVAVAGRERARRGLCGSVEGAATIGERASDQFGGPSRPGRLGVANGAGSQPGQLAATSTGYGGTAESAGNTGRLADVGQPGLEERRGDGRIQRAAMERSAGQAVVGSGDAGGLGNALLAAGELNAGKFPSPQTKVSREDGQKHGDMPDRSEYASAGLGAWSNFEFIPCADGKARRIKSGVFPLAYGFPRKLGQVRAVLEGMGFSPAEVRRKLRQPRSVLAMASRSRVIQLKGSGNTIAGPLAAEFIQAFLEMEPHEA